MKKLLRIFASIAAIFAFALPVYATIGLKPSYPLNDFLIGNTTNLVNSTTTPWFLSGFGFSNATGTSATTTNLFSIKGNFTNLCISGDCKSAWPASGGGSPGGLDTQIQFNDGGTAFGGNAAALFNKSTGLTTLGNLLLTGSSTLQRFTFTNATGTQATTTNFFSTNGIFTNLFAPSLNNLTTNGFVKTSAGNGTLTIDTNTYLTGNQSITLSGDISGSGATAITTAIGSGKVTNTMLAGSIAASKLIGSDITTIGTLSAGAVPASLVTTGTFGTGNYIFPGQLQVNSSTTLQNFTFTNATGTQATTTNFFSTNIFGTTGNLTNLTVTNAIAGGVTGNAGTATKLATARTLAITGDLAYTSPSFDGSGNVTAAGTLATVNTNTGSFGGVNSIPNFTVNGKGLITAAGVNTPAIPASEVTSGAFGSGNYTFPGTLGVTSGLTTLSNLQVNGSSTLQAFTATQSTTTNATTTSFYNSGTASTTVLNANSAAIGSLTVGSCTGCSAAGGGSKFGGTGTDGALTLTSGATNIDAAGATVVIKNYSSISITGSGSLTFTNPAANGTLIILKSQGACTLTSATAPMINASNMGGSGGTAGTGGGSGGSGTAGFASVGTSPGGGGGGSVFGTATPGAAGTVPSNANAFTTSYLSKYNSYFATGGGGSGGTASNSGAGKDGGSGGRGGGAVIMECGGAWNFTTASGISVAGQVGGNSVGGGVSSGGSGGGGGTFVALYNTLTSNSGTVSIAGGAGGSPGTSGGSVTGNGGGGAGAAAAGSGGNSGTPGQPGANGGTGFSYVAQNVEF